MADRRGEESDLLRSFRWVYDLLARAEIGPGEYSTEDRYISEGAGAGQIEELSVSFTAAGVGELPLYHRRKGGVLLQRDARGEKRVWDKIAAVRGRQEERAGSAPALPPSWPETPREQRSGPGRLESKGRRFGHAWVPPARPTPVEPPAEEEEEREVYPAHRTLSWPANWPASGPEEGHDREPVLEPVHGEEMLPFTVKLPAELIERLSTTVFWLRGETLASLTEAALEDHLRKLESQRSERILSEIRKRIDGQNEARQESITRAILLALGSIVRLAEAGAEGISADEREEMRRRATECLLTGVRYWPEAAATALGRD